MKYNEGIRLATVRWAIVEWLKDEHLNGIWGVCQSFPCSHLEYHRYNDAYVQFSGRHRFAFFHPRRRDPTDVSGTTSSPTPPLLTRCILSELAVSNSGQKRSHPSALSPPTHIITAIARTWASARSTPSSSTPPPLGSLTIITIMAILMTTPTTPMMTMERTMMGVGTCTKAVMRMRMMTTRR